MPVLPPPATADPELALLLAEPFVQAWAGAGLPRPADQALRSRLAARLAATRRAEAGLFTTRRRQAPVLPLAEGVIARTLYRAQRSDALRPGEPLHAALIDLAPGAVLEPAALIVAAADGAPPLREWLVLSGSVEHAGDTLTQRDYHLTPAGRVGAPWRSVGGATLFLRESAASAAGDLPFTLRDADAGWPDFAPGIQRRVLWQQGGQAAMLYFAQPGAQVPQHRHGHDEECLMLQGELFLDDLLLQPGDYQLAPAGSGHRVTETDTGVVIYAHGDLALQFVA